MIFFIFILIIYLIGLYLLVVFDELRLGSTSYITTRNGSISQHVEYIAFGEVLFEEHASSFSSPYLFNGKELDRETNLSYYGARYLDMKTSLWLNVDPLAEKYFMNSPYVYVSQNPMNLIDPTGMGEETAGSDPPTAEKIYETVLNLLPKEQRKMVETAVNTLKKNVKDFDFSKLAIGFEKSVGFESSAVVKTEGNAITGNVVFLGGKDAGYVYSYNGAEIGFGIESSVSTGVNAGVSYFLAYNHSGEGGHKSFDGDYDYYRGALGVSTGSITAGVDFGVSGSRTFAKGSDWSLYSMGGSFGVGIGVSTGIVGSGTIGKGNVKFNNGQNIGQPKSFLEKLKSVSKLINPFQ